MGGQRSSNAWELLAAWTVEVLAGQTKPNPTSQNVTSVASLGQKHEPIRSTVQQNNPFGKWWRGQWFPNITLTHHQSLFCSLMPSGPEARKQMKFPFACHFPLLMDRSGLCLYFFCLHKITVLSTKGADGTEGSRSGRIASHENGASRALSWM